MTIETIRLRRAALGCVLEALPKWRKTGIRIANHSLKVNGERREWLTIFRKDGSLILWEHFPDSACSAASRPQISARAKVSDRSLFGE